MPLEDSHPQREGYLREQPLRGMRVRSPGLDLIRPRPPSRSVYRIVHSDQTAVLVPASTKPSTP
ncbi:MAG: hypothetical protein RLZZ142_2609 [Verrucomicrobiota bacterium]